VELWLCSLEPRNVLDRYGKWLHGVKQCAERLCRLHVIPQMMEVFNRHGPILSDSNWGSQMAGISKKTNERLGSNLSVLVSIICFSCARSMWFKQCTTCELDEDKVKSDVSFSHLENVMETSFCGTRGSRSLKANKFDSLCPVFECNGTKFSSLSDLVSHLLEVSSGFDAMVKQFPVEDVLDFLEGNKLMKLEKLVGKWVLDKDSSENVVAANLDLCEAQDVDDTIESTSGPPEDTETPSSTAADTQTTEQSTQQPNSSASQAIVEIDGTDKEEENGEADDGIGDETTASLLESYITAEKRKKLDNTSASAQEIQQLAKKRQRSNASGNSSWQWYIIRMLVNFTLTRRAGWRRQLHCCKLRSKQLKQHERTIRIMVRPKRSEKVFQLLVLVTTRKIPTQMTLHLWIIIAFFVFRRGS
jgi:hypothetical protein